MEEAILNYLWYFHRWAGLKPSQRVGGNYRVYHTSHVGMASLSTRRRCSLRAPPAANLKHVDKPQHWGKTWATSTAHTIGFIFYVQCISWIMTYHILSYPHNTILLLYSTVGHGKGHILSCILESCEPVIHRGRASSESATYCDRQQSAWASAWHRPMAGQLDMAVQKWWLSLHKCQEKGIRLQKCVAMRSWT